MYKIVKHLILLAIVSPILLQAQANEAMKKQTDLGIYPKADEGYKRVIIQVPAKKSEDLLKLEIVAGKTEQVDCNHYFISGTIEEQMLEGGGYVYYKVVSDGQMGGTRMACPDQKKTQRFIQMPSRLTSYNSKIPLVVYVPIDMEVKYRVWKAGKTLKSSVIAK